MTIETMQSVVDELQKRNILAYVEHPGWINVPIAAESGDFQLACGDANENIGIDVIDMNDGKSFAEIESDIDGDSTDVQSIAGFIQAVYMKQIGGESIA